MVWIKRILLIAVVLLGLYLLYAGPYRSAVAVAFVGLYLYWMFLGQYNTIGTPIDWLFCPRYPVYKQGGIVVTGTSHGIGRAAALALDKMGYTVFAVARKASDGESIKAEASERLIPVLLDLGKPETYDAALSQIKQVLLERKQQLIGLANVAGLAPHAPFEGHSDEEIQALLDTNIRGTLLLTKRFLPLLRKSSGRILCTGGPPVGFPYHSIKTAANSALEGFCESMRAELRMFKVSVSLLTPAAVKTPVYENLEEKSLAARAKLSEEIQQTYPEGAMWDPVFSMNWTTRAIVHAMTARYPRPRYTSTPAGSMATKMRRKVIPDRMFDAIICKRLGLSGK